MKKFLILLLVTALLLVGGAVFFLMRNLNDIVHTVIETSGTELLGQPVAVKGVDLSLTGGSGEITGLTIGNPEGFTDPHAFVLDRIRVDIDLKSVQGSPKRLTEFVVEAPEMFVEVLDDNTVNLEVLVAHMESQGADKPEPEEKARPETPEEEAKAARLAVDRLRITGVKLTIRHRKLEGGVRVVTLPDIELADVGGEDGLTGAKLGFVIVKAMAKQGTEAALKDEIGRQADRLIQKGLNKLFEK